MEEERKTQVVVSLLITIQKHQKKNSKDFAIFGLLGPMMNLRGLGWLPDTIAFDFNLYYRGKNIISSILKCMTNTKSEV